MSLEILRDEAAFAQLAGDWKRLRRESASRHFFHDFSWKWHSWRCVASGQGDALRVLVVRRGVRVVLILPIAINGRVARFLNSATWEYRDMMVDDVPGLDDSLRAVWRALSDLREFDVLLLQNGAHAVGVVALAGSSRAAVPTCGGRTSRRRGCCRNA
jgi:hypothetical protein